ncbi:MAG: hypothetical protein ACPGWR_33405 [Ardenticatenaceae bacterium]
MAYGLFQPRRTCAEPACSARLVELAPSLKKQPEARIEQTGSAQVLPEAEG